jgi:hypothetical protein
MSILLLLPMSLIHHLHRGTLPIAVWLRSQRIGKLLAIDERKEEKSNTQI